MRPIIITTPRTGSTLVCELLFNIAAHRFKYKNNLGEYFTITTLYKANYQKVNGLIRSMDGQRSDYDRSKATYDSDDIKLTALKLAERSTILHRIELLRNDPLYMIKLFSSDFTPEVLDFVTKTYDMVYLERKNKVKQFLSFLGLVQTNTSHYTKESPRAVLKIIYDTKWAKQFVQLDKLYQDCKHQHPGPVLYYEDFIAAGADESALIELLDLSVTGIKNKTIQTVPTPYTTDIEDLVVNKEEWLRDRDDFLNQLRLNAQGN